MIPSIFLAFYLMTQPESPRWHLVKAHQSRKKKVILKYYRRTLHSLIRLRGSELLAARDMILLHYRLLKEDERRQEPDTVWHQRGVYEVFATRRCRGAFIAIVVVLFFQQFCGINVLIFYSGLVLLQADYRASKALLVSSARHL